MMLDIGSGKLSCLSCLLSVLPPAKRKLVSKVAFNPSPLPGYVVEERRLGDEVRHACFPWQGRYRQLPLSESFPCPRCAVPADSGAGSRVRHLSHEGRNVQKDACRSHSVPPQERTLEEFEASGSRRLRELRSHHTKEKEEPDRFCRCEKKRATHLLPPTDPLAFTGDASDRHVTQASHQKALHAVNFDGFACAPQRHVSQPEECRFPEVSSQGTGASGKLPTWSAESTSLCCRRVDQTPETIPSIVVTSPGAENHPFSSSMSAGNNAGFEDVLTPRSLPQFPFSPSPAAALEYAGRTSRGKLSFPCANCASGAIGDAEEPDAGDCPLKWYRHEGRRVASLSSPLQPSERSVYADVMGAFRWLKTEKNVKLRDLVMYGQSIGSVAAVHLASVLGRRRQAALARLEKKEKSGELAKRKQEKKEQRRQEEEKQERLKKLQRRAQATQGGRLPSRFSRLLRRGKAERVHLVEFDDSSEDSDEDDRLEAGNGDAEHRRNQAGRAEDNEDLETIGGVILHSALASGLRAVRSRLKKKDVVPPELQSSFVYEVSTAPTVGTPSSVASSSPSTSHIYSLMLAEYGLEAGASVDRDQRRRSEQKKRESKAKDKTPWYDILRNVDKMKHISAPAFVIHGTEDAIVPIGSGELLASSAAVSFSPFVAKSAGHNDVDKGEWREAYFESLRDFFDFLSVRETCRATISDGQASQGENRRSGEAANRKRFPTETVKSGRRAMLSLLTLRGDKRSSCKAEPREATASGNRAASPGSASAVYLPSGSISSVGSFASLSSSGSDDAWVCPRFSTSHKRDQARGPQSPAHRHLPSFSEPSGAVYHHELARRGLQGESKSEAGKEKGGRLRYLFTRKPRDGVDHPSRT
ncbi:conserved hypothetical protein [Neospora caninum Liverpool]|uniref:Alpha/beta hydrolase family protein n=1 Tax=Neospora caninum (strain Liverpool) TaxID=572307 RepID=F0VQ80_NEOCL|nr:conserved hypothetical protein [Neospora caninum Liverpool]CBZ55877.1 conserved hypothetical protein [Neospora caninum Liverpool]CEL70620.1 TPA: hypothetical protein BN1204_063030 [Neospora caninum Liverpool]|eukprot:XP_003885903.1 conserved hypothetical protein [Neospora caninum Liverpool]